MSLSSVFRRSLWLMVPAVLAMSGCSDDKKDPAPDQGRINFYHAAASANVSLKALVDDAEKATFTYGQASGYQTLTAGSHTIKINVSGSTTTLATQSATVEKDKSYSFFAYANTIASVGGLLVNDDLTAPTAGKAKIRLVHLGLDAGTPLKLSTTVASVSDVPGTEVQFPNASAFVEILPGSYNIAVTTGPGSTTITNVGDGSGNGTIANKTYEAGKIYTVLVRGVNNAILADALKPHAYLIQHN